MRRLDLRYCSKIYAQFGHFHFAEKYFVSVMLERIYTYSWRISPPRNLHAIVKAQIVAKKKVAYTCAKICRIKRKSKEDFASANNSPRGNPSQAELLDTIHSTYMKL